MFGWKVMKVSQKKSSKPFFTIITCTLNSGEFLQDNINSLRKQENQDFEHIFVDGLSSDQTGRLINRYRKVSQTQVKLISAQPCGVANAFNLGIAKASGKYLIFLNSDDFLFDKKALIRAKKFLTDNGEPDWVYGKIQTIDHNGKPIGVFPRHLFFQTALPWLLTIINYIPHQAVFIKKSVFDTFGKYDENLKICMDYDYWLRIRKKTSWMHYPQIISKYRVHTDSLTYRSENLKLLRSERQMIQEKYVGKTLAAAWKLAHKAVRAVFGVKA